MTIAGGILRNRRRLFIGFLALCVVFIFANRMRGGSLNAMPRYLKDVGTGPKVSELDALLYMVTKTEDVLPEDFDTGSKRLDMRVFASGRDLSKKGWKKRVTEMRRTKPMVVFSKSYCPYSKRAIKLLAGYELHPAPHIIQVDERSDSAAMKALLGRTTGRSTFPNIVWRGKSIGGSDELQAMHDRGELYDLFADDGWEMGQ
ncbi:thioredoxin-like protein [Sistotremastrum niveocremeum HHB9708]|uniref:Thioredoxin-like protein n=2 Tax=Sistotremastraceae TaxID=3402574 RepID=A0A164ZWW6_9AGAM|nr:thioredoxin-like protein [Sistotremastrum niveocremeum HHB9708]KZT40759.1 thioredoxin-like protein [Sistotremastrum suecicum HHB10207 ss-3]